MNTEKINEKIEVHACTSRVPGFFDGESISCDREATVVTQFGPRCSDHLPRV